MICKYCEQEIYKTKLEESFPGNGIWVHMRGKYLHIKNDKWACEDNLVNKNNPNYESPQCHICETETNKHESICSASGYPRFKAWLAEDKISDI